MELTTLMQYIADARQKLTSQNYLETLKNEKRRIQSVYHHTDRKDRRDLPVHSGLTTKRRFLGYVRTRAIRLANLNERSANRDDIDPKQRQALYDLVSRLLTTGDRWVSNLRDVPADTEVYFDPTSQQMKPVDKDFVDVALTADYQFIAVMLPPEKHPEQQSLFETEAVR